MIKQRDPVSCIIVNNTPATWSLLIAVPFLTARCIHLQHLSESSLVDHMLFPGHGFSHNNTIISKGGSLRRLFSLMQNRSIQDLSGRAFLLLTPSYLWQTAFLICIRLFCHCAHCKNHRCMSFIRHSGKKGTHPTESASRSSMTFPAPKKRGTPGF